MDALALPADLIPAERHQHDQIEAVETVKAGQKAGRVVNALDRLLRDGKVLPGGHSAKEGGALKDVADKYQALVRQAGYEPKPQSPGWQRIDNGTADNEFAHVAADQIHKADAAIGEIHASCLRFIVIEGGTPTGWAHKRGYYRPEVGLAYLIDGLRLLRRHWRM